MPGEVQGQVINWMDPAAIIEAREASSSRTMYYICRSTMFPFQCHKLCHRLSSQIRNVLKYGNFVHLIIPLIIMSCVFFAELYFCVADR